ncbi:Gamma-glutamyltranspeptidase [Acidisarcina polymorpha]|uniref:Glutathione hydrolase proenzyme n=2 Tax=Acidisarcina polymorpha TaxID=2211140 RepID=A0A2Z5FTR1_9BACT|nr:Gamma-glutamyltranspeptidase [Acidisarcina polymorpha]
MIAVLFAPPLMAAQDPAREQSRSIVMTQYGIVATSQAVASQAGAAVLAKGGSAVDAAIAANAALGVIEPMMNGVGGDLFAVVYDAKTKHLYGLNSGGWAPKNLTVDALKAKGLTKMRPIDQLTVPGTVAGWDALHGRWGKLSLAQDVAPAIALATHGIGVTETDADNWNTYGTPFHSNPEFAKVFLPEGKAPVAGQLFNNPELAKTLGRIGDHGRDGFYKGETAAAILKLEGELGGFMEADDLAEFKPEWVDPVSTTYHGWTIYELPPNGQGIAALSMLNIMEQFPIKEWGHNSQRSLHVEIEAKKLAYADLQRYVGDPKATHIPTKELISKELAVKRAKLITDKAACTVMPSDLQEQLSHLSSDTTYLSVVDRDGNEVSLIQSNAGAFGGGLVAPGTGFALQNRGGGFTLQPDRPNTLRPRTRPLHTIIPGFMEKGDRRIAFGIMGGFNQAQAHAQFVSNVVDFDMNIQAALESSRFTKRDFPGCGVWVENGVAPDVVAALRAQGHEVTVWPRYFQSMGRGNAVEVNEGSPVHYGATDPRADGEAVPEQMPF